MKKLFLFFTGLFFSFTVSSQSCLPQGITFATQAQIDSFQINSPNCTQIEGDVTISGGNITNLNGLSVLTSIGGSLSISSCGTLTSLTGLDNVTSIGEELAIQDNDALTSLTGLGNVTSIGGYLEIYYNTALTSLTGLDNVTSIGGYLDIYDNDSLTSLTGLEGLTSIGSNLDVFHNNSLTTLTGLNNVTTIGGNLYIQNNDALTSVTELENVTSIGEGLWIYQNAALTSLTGLNNVTSIGLWLQISSNAALTSLAGLEGLTSIGGSLSIKDNPALTSLTGLDNIDAGSIHSLYIFDNDTLSNCVVQSICDYLVSPNGTIEIHDNSTGCNSQAEVDSACVYLSTNEILNENLLSVYPNPSSDFITIETSSTPTPSNVIIMNLNGQALITRQITQPKTQLDINSLPSGVYFVRLPGDRTVQVGKFVKQ